MPMYALFNPKADSKDAEFGQPAHRFEGDDPIAAFKKFIGYEDWDAESFLESNFENTGKAYVYMALMGMETGTISVVKVAADPGTGEFDVSLAELP